MQKVTDFLEKNVEWIAIGLGALFMLYMTWSYVLNPVAGVKIGQDDLGPGEVDPHALTHVGKQLESAMNENTRLPTTVPSYVGAFKETMSWSKAPIVVLDNIWPLMKADIELPVTAVVGGAPAPGPGGVVPPAPKDGAVKVTMLPKPPPATPAEHKFGRSVVMVPGPDGVLPPAPVVQPGQPVEGGTQKDWITQMFKIDMAALDKAFQASKLPPAPLNTTAFLQVEMEREELDENGQPVPGTLKVIAPIPVYRGATPPPAFPADGATKDEQAAYLTWAAANSGDVLQPLFYTVAKGDQWSKPGAQPAVVVEFDPATFKGDLSSLPPDQRQQVLDARREAQRLKDEERRKSRPSRPTGPGRPGPIEGGGGIGQPGINYAPRDHSTPRDNYAPAPGRRPGQPAQPGYGGPPELRGDGMGGIGMEGGFGPGMGGYPGAGGVTPASLPQPGVDYPNAEFEPAKWNTKTVECWAHDDTVEPNKTYRYRVRYKIKNPIWAAGNVADPPTLADQFALVSEWSSWTSPVTIPPLVNFFVLNPKAPNGTTVRFEVFKWENGEPKSAAFTVGPGDQVGGTKDGIDFATGWTIVDFRDDPRSDTQILLVNDQGKLITRSHRADQGDTLYKGLKDQITAAKALETAAVNGAAPATPGR